jgi:hypothetical protein
MVYIADDLDPTTKRLNVIGVNKCDGNNFKVIQSSMVKLKKRAKVVSKSITSTNHMLLTFNEGSCVLLHLNNFTDLHVHGSPSDESVYAAGNLFLMAHERNVGVRNFTEFFLN